MEHQRHGPHAAGPSAFNAVLDLGGIQFASMKAVLLAGRKIAIGFRSPLAKCRPPSSELVPEIT